MVLPANSVGSKQIKNRSIQRIDIGRRTVASLRGQRGLRGPAGIQGVKGDKGDTGDPGAPGSSVAFARITLTPGGATFRGMAADQCPLWRVGAR